MSLKISSDSNFEIWTGEHWQSYLRVPGNDENSGSFSLYLTDHSVFGSGIVVLVNIPEISSLSGVYTDNLKLSSFILNKIVSRTSDYPFPDEMEIYDSDILRFEDSSGEIGWRIIHSQNEIIGSLGLNYDISIFEQFSDVLSYFTGTKENPVTHNSELFFYGSTKEDIQISIKHFRVANGLTHKAFSRKDKYNIIEFLIKAGHLNKRGAVPIISDALSITRPTVYKYIKDIKAKN